MIMLCLSFVFIIYQFSLIFFSLFFLFTLFFFNVCLVSFFHYVFFCFFRYFYVYIFFSEIRFLNYNHSSDHILFFYMRLIIKLQSTQFFCTNKLTSNFKVLGSGTNSTPHLRLVYVQTQRVYCPSVKPLGFPSKKSVTISSTQLVRLSEKTFYLQ